MMMHNPDLQQKIAEAIANPKNMGEMESADAVGAVGSPNCGDMVRMWVKFKDENGKKIIDRATFQAFGCETAIAVASLATEMIKGKTVDEAFALTGQDLAKDLGPLPPMKIHCGELVEGALRSALRPTTAASSIKTASSTAGGSTLLDSFAASTSSPNPVKMVFLKDGE